MQQMTSKGPQVMSKVSLDDKQQGISCVLCCVSKERPAWRLGLIG